MILGRSFLKRYKFHAILALAALVWLMVFDWLTQMSAQGIIYPDSFSYWVSADNLYVHLRGHNFRPILMAAISGIPYMFGGGKIDVFNFSFLVNTLCWIGFAWAMFGILRQFLSERRSFFIALGSLFFLGNVALVFHLLTETIYLFMVTVAFYWLFNYEKSGKHRFLAFALTMLLLTMLIRPGGMVFAVLAAAFYMRPVWRNLRSRWNVLAAGALLLILVQCSGMKYQFGNFTLSYIDSVTYYNYLGSKADAFDKEVVFSQENNPRTTAIYPLSGPEQKFYAAADFKNQLLNNTDDLVLAYADNLLENSKTGSTAIADCRNVEDREVFAGPHFFWISKWQNRFFSVIGILAAAMVLFRKRVSIVFRVMSLFVLTTIFLSGISCSQGDRFHIVVFPTVLVLLAKIWMDFGTPKPSAGPPRTG